MISRDDIRRCINISRHPLKIDGNVALIELNQCYTELDDRLKLLFQQNLWRSTGADREILAVLIKEYCEDHRIKLNWGSDSKEEKADLMYLKTILLSEQFQYYARKHNLFENMPKWLAGTMYSRKDLNL